MEIKAHDVCKCDRNKISDESKKMRTKIQVLESRFESLAVRMNKASKEMADMANEMRCLLDSEGSNNG